MYFVSIPSRVGAVGEPFYCSTFRNGQQENKLNGATLSISVILRDILVRAYPCRHPTCPPTLSAVELSRLQKLQHFASESPGKQIALIPSILTKLEIQDLLLVNTHYATNSTLAAGPATVRPGNFRKQHRSIPPGQILESVLDQHPSKVLELAPPRPNGRTNPPRR